MLPMIFDKQTIDAVNQRFQFVCDGTEQDWPIEVSDKDRLQEFIVVLKSEQLSEKEEIAIVALAIASYEDYLSVCADPEYVIWNDISQIISRNKLHYSELVDYWSLVNEQDATNMFQVSPLMRALAEKNEFR
jgi:hypothetical protein